MYIYRLFVPKETDIIALFITKFPEELLSGRTNIRGQSRNKPTAPTEYEIYQNDNIRGNNLYTQLFLIPFCF